MEAYAIMEFHFTALHLFSLFIRIFCKLEEAHFKRKNCGIFSYRQMEGLPAPLNVPLGSQLSQIIINVVFVQLKENRGKNEKEKSR